jgi:enamine deaminase RidA (YjgF/YER057c/UK114 family)
MPTVVTKESSLGLVASTGRGGQTTGAVVNVPLSPPLAPDEKDITMERKAINPWPWSLQLGFDQAQLVHGHRRELICSAQDAVDANGNPQHPGDMVAQLGHALDNLEAVLAGADMTLINVVKLNFYTTDMETLLQHFPIATERFEGNRFATTVLGVSSLAAPQLLVAIEATAMD